jgi:Domain of unknown function (DUF1990)
MTETSEAPKASPRDTGNWAERVEGLKVGKPPSQAKNINVEGRRVASPIQGFGQMWQKTYLVALAGLDHEPSEILTDWQKHFAAFQPPANRFHLPASGMNPGGVALIDSQIARVPMVSTGVMVLYRDDESFTFMTPEGHPEAGWITFSVSKNDDGCAIAQIQSLARAADPLYEIGFRLFGSRMQEGIWRHVLTQLAGFYDLEAPVSVERIRVDKTVQWRKAGNIWQNAQIRTTLHTMKAPIRALRR